MQHLSSKIGLFLLLIIMVGCNSDTTSKTSNKGKLFRQVSVKQSGIDFSNDLIDDPLDNDRNCLSFQSYFNGGGVGIGDINNDGLEDIVFSGNEVNNRLYLNKGNLKFEDITAKSGINVNKNWTAGVTMSDVNNDGYLDIYICQSSKEDKSPEVRRNLLYINNGDLTFTERAKEYGLDDPNYGAQAIFFDADNDGDNDCFIVNNSKYARANLNMVYQEVADEAKRDMASSQLYINNGSGRFVKRTKEAGLLRFGYGLSGVVSDINNDGYLDIYQANDYSVPDFMYINNGDGTFTDEIKDRTKQLSWFSMGMDIADINNDGHEDIAVVDMSSTDHVRGKTLMAPMSPEMFSFIVDYRKDQRQHMFNALHINNSDGTYNNMAGLYGVLSSEWSWAALLADFDNDGWKDYYVANGFRRYSRDNDSRIRMQKARQANGNSVPMSMRKQLYDQIPQIEISNYIFKNKEGYKFEEYSNNWGVNIPSYSNGAAYGDLDNDGDLDLVVNNIDEHAFLFENTASQQGRNFLTIELSSKQSKVGTKVTVYTSEGFQTVEHKVSRGYYSSVSHKVLFGLGSVETIDSLKVQWPGNYTQVIKNPKINTVLELNRKNASKGQRISPSLDKLVVPTADLDFVHQENEFDDFDKEILLPYKQSTLGPYLSKGDVNGDGLEDVFVGGAKGQAGRLFVQSSSGQFDTARSQPWSAHTGSEDMGALFFDYDGDDDLDLYVASGGSEFRLNDIHLQDRIYTNDGKGNYSYVENVLPEFRQSSSRVVSTDLNKDGKLDLIVGGRVVPQQYPRSAPTKVLINRGKRFEDQTEQWLEDSNLGLVNAIELVDIDGDGNTEIAIVGEWMPIKLFSNTGEKLEDISDNVLPKALKGWWYSIKAADIDNDGDQDLIVGNLGLNSKFKASDKKEFKVLANDFDDNGSIDIVLAKEYKGKTVPVRGRECSSEQMPFISEKFESYSAFANADITQMLGESKIKEGLQRSVNTFESGVLTNQGGSFDFQPFARLAQSFPIMGIEVADLDKNGHQDIILTGNIYDMEIETPRLDSGDGMVLLNQGNHEFTISRSAESGFYTPLNTKDILVVNGSSKKVLVSNNNGSVQGFELIN